MIASTAIKLNIKSYLIHRIFYTAHELSMFSAQLAGAVEYTDCISAEGGVRPPPSPTSVLDMTLNLMVKLESWSFTLTWSGRT